MFMVKHDDANAGARVRICHTQEEAIAVATQFAQDNKTEVSIYKEHPKGAYDHKIAAGALPSGAFSYHDKIQYSPQFKRRGANDNQAQLSGYVLSVFRRDTKTEIITFDTKEEALEFSLKHLLSEEHNPDGMTRIALIEATEKSPILPSSSSTVGDPVYLSITKLDDNSLRATGPNQEFTQISQNQTGDIIYHSHDDVVSPFTQT